MKKRKICVITGSRAEYGLLFWLIKSIKEDPKLELQLIVTGMHLSPEFGLTYKKIIEDGFLITKKIELLMSSDSSIGISKSIGLGVISFSEAFMDLNPDICVVLGDRFEIFSAVVSSMVSRIPIAHIHGGESTEGAIDEAIRHSITKMSHLHFVATNEYAKRVIQLGENPNTVFNFGSPCIDNINNLKLFKRSKFEKLIDFKLGKLNFLVTFHPVTLENKTSENQFKELLMALSNFKNAKIIFTMPNADTDGSKIISALKIFVKGNKNAFLFDSLGQTRYLSCLEQVDGVIGNSSSGLTEAPSFRIGTINIGDRQGGRLKAASVIDCDPKYLEIKNAIVKLYSSSFQRILKSVENPYGKPGASKKLLEIIKKVNLEGLIKKSFFDL